MKYKLHSKSFCFSILLTVLCTTGICQNAIDIRWNKPTEGPNSSPYISNWIKDGENYVGLEYISADIKGKYSNSGGTVALITYAPSLEFVKDKVVMVPHNGVGTRNHKSFVLNNKFILFSSYFDKKSKEVFVYASIITKEGQIEKQNRIGYLQNVSSGSDFFLKSLYSLDSLKILVSLRYENGAKVVNEFISLDQDLNELWHITPDLPFSYKTFNPSDLTLDRENNLHFIVHLYNTETKNIFLFSTDGKSKNITKTDLGVLSWDDQKIYLYEDRPNELNVIVLFKFHDESNVKTAYSKYNNRLYGYRKIKINLQNWNKEQDKFFEFDSAFRENFYKVDDSEKSVPIFTIDFSDRICLSNGNFIIGMQNTYNDGTIGALHDYAEVKENIQFMCFDPSGSIVWKNIIQRSIRTKELNFLPGLRSFLTATYGNKLVVLFNAHEKYIGDSKLNKVTSMNNEKEGITVAHIINEDNGSNVSISSLGPIVDNEKMIISDFIFKISDRLFYLTKSNTKNSATGVISITK